MYMIGKQDNKRNLALLARFFAVLIIMVTAYSIVFHYIMAWEGKDPTCSVRFSILTVSRLPMCAIRIRRGWQRRATRRKTVRKRSRT